LIIHKVGRRQAGSRAVEGLWKRREGRYAFLQQQNQIQERLSSLLVEGPHMQPMPDKLMLSTLSGKASRIPPVWLMRQAGRYLPEYRAVRAKAGSFLDLCYSPDFATEVTLQPIRRFGFDAAILFSDILVVPHALGQHVTFAEGEGPRLESITDREGLARLRPAIDLQHLEPVFETLRRLRTGLPVETTLIGFCGAPWTVASYMIAGKGTPDQAPARIMAYRDPEFLQMLIDRLVEASIAYLKAQVAAGAEVIQLFESFASALPPQLIGRWSFDPMLRIVEGVRAVHPDVPFILFARGAGPALSDLSRRKGVTAMGLDWGVDLAWARETIAPGVVTQGNLDPLALIAGGEALDRAVDHVLQAMEGQAHVFNLGHGILPETPIAHVERMLTRIRR
jgi:uroporphyrinogen decarboxylase